MLDLAYQSQFPPAAWGLGIGEWIRYFGDPANPDALAQMTAHSPVTHAADLSVPTLIHAGRWDGVTGFEQVEAFLAAAGPDAPIDSLIFDEAGHGLSRWQDNVTRARRIEAFLATHLGGRAEGASVADLGAKLVK